MKRKLNWDFSGKEPDEHLIKVWAILDKEGNEQERFRLRTGDSIWIYKQTRVDMFYVYKYIYEQYKSKGRNSISLNRLFKKFKTQGITMHRLVYLMCFMKNNLVKMSAIQSPGTKKRKPYKFTKIEIIA